MTVGDPSRFAIESAITDAYERLSLLGLGFFVIHVGGRRYGVYSPDATMLACSLDTVEKRIAHRGKHTSPFATELDAGKIADAVRNAIYANEDERDESYFGVSRPEFEDLIRSNHILWAPDGDEAFDDGSFVLQFDVMDRVRLVAFTSGENYLHDPPTLRDVWLPAEEFYDVLQRWRKAFLAEWATMRKVVDST
jgi:hypothetical protein